MTQNPLKLIGYTCGLGAKKKTCSQGPGKLLHMHLERLLSQSGIPTNWAPLYHSDDEINQSLVMALADYIQHLQKQVKQTLTQGEFPITLGGDHSMALGTWSEITQFYKTKGKFGLIWIDAHLDSHTTQTSHTRAYHGMPVSYLLGYGDDELRGLLPEEPLVKPENLVFIGARSFEREEQLLLDKLNVKIYYMEEILTRGIHEVLQEALGIVTKRTKGFGISIDVDAFDPNIAPGTGCLEIGGLTREDTLLALQNLGHHPHLLGLEIAEFNPSLDKENRTAYLILDIIKSMFRPGPR